MCPLTHLIQVWKRIDINLVKKKKKKKKESKASWLWSARKGPYNNWKHLKIWESALFNAYVFNFIKTRGSLFEFFGGAGLLLTCDAHFQTQMSYFSQKSCVKIWFGLVEIGDMLIFWGEGGGEKPPIRGWLHVTCDTHFWTWPSYFSQKSCVNICLGLVEAFKSYRGNIQKYIYILIIIITTGSALVERKPLPTIVSNSATFNFGQNF